MACYSINQISRNGRQLTLEPRLIDLLVFFAQHSGEVLSRDELIDNVWKRSIVTNHVVTQSISELRKSLKIMMKIVLSISLLYQSAAIN